ncbi:STAS domain-containing protein [Streptomyces sp. NPDC098789]|uniref:STAS domain-containing protein n=1 Tax=Streptomyces sp. NPDC098789 TaxID=3366098 RepID=UPI0037F4311A
MQQRARYPHHVSIGPPRPATPPCPGVPVADIECVSEPDRTVVIRMSGQFDMETIHVINDALAAFATYRTILDVSGTAFADSSFLNALLAARTRHQLILAGPVPDQLHRLLEVTGALTLFRCTPDVAAAHGIDPSEATTAWSA